MWEFEHSVETTASREFIWNFWTDVANWAFDTSVEWVRLDGPFVSGTRGETKSPGLDPVQWTLTEVRPQEEAIVEIVVQDMTLRFHWRFEDLAQRGTLITQHASVTGSNVEPFIQEFAPRFEHGIPEGMRKLVAEVERAEQRQRDNTI